MNAGKTPPAVGGRVRRPAKSGCGSRLATRLRPALRGLEGRRAVGQRRRASITERGSGFAGAEGAARPAGRAEQVPRSRRGDARTTTNAGLRQPSRASPGVAPSRAYSGDAGVLTAAHHQDEQLADASGAYTQSWRKRHPGRVCPVASERWSVLGPASLEIDLKRHSLAEPRGCWCAEGVCCFGLARRWVSAVC